MAEYRTFKDESFTGNKVHQVNGAEIVDDTLTHAIFINDGPGDIDIKIAFSNGTVGAPFTIKSGEKIDIERTINKVQMVHTGVDSAYRIIAY